MHHNYVSHLVEIGRGQSAIEAAAGPLFSLLLGVIITFFAIKTVKPSLFKLFLQWLGMGNILTFLGYMLIAPIAKNGDTGRVFDYLGVPIYSSIALAILSFLFINWLFAKFATEFVFYKNDEIFNQNETKKQLFVYPIYGSIILMTLLNLPIVTWVSLLPTIFMPMTYFGTMGKYRRLTITDAPVLIDSISYPLVVLCVLSIALFRFLV